ncbi:MAG: hypothetical protein KDC43_06370 [Saprospiraceae bacterium]|nr:hypothetical protein [Saprospiraceae bacterium]MCB0623537.1 hypothetical protein [Saprospiraceae bacterium]MCB0677211.1 hypothetical protein [Saprospiraceae bacterium]MCB0680034.1 hypothetical protein [Saprospiraceae bacterium]
MKKQQINRKHNFPDADLYLECVERIRLAQADLEQFEQYGYDRERLKKFLAQCEKFRELPGDDELVGEQMIMTDKKYDSAEKLKSAIRSLMTRVAMKYNNRSGRYRKFGTAKMGDMTDAQLIFCARRVVRVARQQIDFLAEVGVNENIIGRVSTACRDFENAVNLQHDRVAERDIAVERRVEAANKLYEELVTLSNVGKDIWAERDRTRYEQYALYESNNEQKKARKAKSAEEA